MTSYPRPVQTLLRERTWLEMQEGVRRVNELWVELLMVEQMEALKKIWKETR